MEVDVVLSQAPAGVRGGNGAFDGCRERLPVPYLFALSDPRDRQDLHQYRVLVGAGREFYKVRPTTRNFPIGKYGSRDALVT